METEKQPRKWRRWLRRVLKVLLVILLVLVLLHAIWNYIAGRRLERQLQAMREAREPVTVADLYPELPYPESENAAHVYRAAFELMTGLNLDSKEYPFLERAWADTDSTRWSEEDAEGLRRLLDKYRLPIDLGRRAAHMPHCRFMPQFSPAGIPVAFEELTKIRHLAWLILLDSMLKLRDRDADGALEGCTTAFLTTRSLEENPELLTFLVRVAFQQISLQAAEAVLNQADPSIEKCQGLLVAAREAARDLRPGLRAAFEGERVFSISMVEAMFGGVPLLAERFAPGQHSALGKRVPYWRRPLQRARLAGLLGATAQLPALAQQPYPQVRPAIDDLVAAEEAARPSTAMWKALRNPGRVLGIMRVPSFVKAKEEETKAEARLAVAQVALALRLCKAERGEYPDSLGSLSPDPLSTVPTDPFKGTPLVYGRKDGGFLVYSIGLNGKDDGGLTETWKDGEKVNLGADDIAWRAPR